MFTIFFDPKELRQWLRQNNSEYLLLTDFDLGNGKATEFDFILTQDLISKSILMTNSYDDSGLLGRVEEAGIKIFPKPLAKK